MELIVLYYIKCAIMFLNRNNPRRVTNEQIILQIFSGCYEAWKLFYGLSYA